MFDGKIRIREGQIDRSRGELANTLYHEYTHALLGTLRTQVPTWFNEGLAMHFEPTPDGPDRVRRHLAPIPADQLPTVAQLGGSFARVRDPAVVHVLYACAYDLVDELIRMRGVRSLASLVAAIEKGMTFPEALDDVYDVDSALLDRKWRERRAQR